MRNTYIYIYPKSGVFQLKSFIQYQLSVEDLNETIRTKKIIMSYHIDFLKACGNCLSFQIVAKFFNKRFWPRFDLLNLEENDQSNFFITYTRLMLFLLPIILKPNSNLFPNFVCNFEEEFRNSFTQMSASASFGLGLIKSIINS